MTEPIQETFRTSESINKIAPALLKAQQTMGAATKGAANPFYKSKYADLAEVMEVCKEPFNDNGILILQPVSTGEHGVVVTTLFLHTSGEWLSSAVYFPSAKVDSQEYGKCVSYARRYSLQSFAFIPAVDDDGNTASGKVSPPTYSKALIQDFPPETDLYGILLRVEEPVSKGSPATVKIETHDGIMTYSAFAVEDRWVDLEGQPIRYQYVKDGRRWVISKIEAGAVEEKDAPQQPVTHTMVLETKDSEPTSPATDKEYDFYAFGVGNNYIGQIIGAKKFTPKDPSKKASWMIRIGTRDEEFEAKLWESPDFDWESWNGKQVWYRIREGEFRGQKQYTLEALQEYIGEVES